MTQLKIGDAINTTCPWSGDPIQEDSLTLYNGAVVGFCNPGCRDKLEKAVNHFDAALQRRSYDSV
ncbi:glutathione S-transferase [Phyllobacterium endophyticum]|uniref:glutathione S-transferase n=1 Tax=Phyllobacterium endophyticum TaxID=1149773 RepID=UPI0011CAA9BA|nr:glutathione S-transferase [Phyllobacterium endophyticum]TXR48223.1 glutathione S-transferase [Phyllobacterium endophyticum]